MQVKFHLEVEVENSEEEGLLEMEFAANFGYEPDEYLSNGARVCWYLDGEITDNDGNVYSQGDIDLKYNKVHGVTLGYPWEELEIKAAKEYEDCMEDGLIEAYEDRKMYEG